MRIASLESFDVLDPGTVSVLNRVGHAADGAAATGAGDGQPGLRYSTNKDISEHIAICGAGYAALSSQLDQILGIEDRRFPLE